MTSALHLNNFTHGQGKSTSDMDNQTSFWESVINTSPNGIYVKNTQGEYLWFNDLFSQHIKNTHGITTSIIGEKDSSIFREEIAYAYQKNDQEIMKDGVSCSYEERFISKNNKKSHISFIKKPLYNHAGEIIGVVAYTADITDLKETREKLTSHDKTNARQAGFISNISHDIRDPLMGVSTLLNGLLFAIEDMLSSLGFNSNSSKDKLMYFLDISTKHTKEYLMVAKSSTNELVQYLDSVVENTQPNCRNIKTRPSAFNLYSLVQSLTDLLRPIAKHKELGLTLDIADSVPIHLSGLHLRLHRVLLNLISNALRFTDNGSITIAIKLVGNKDKNLPSPGDEITLEIEIRDTGAGISKDSIDGIFNESPSLSFDNMNSDLGLGLYTVKRYVDILKGTINIESTPSKGSCFTLTLPFTVEEWSPAIYEPLDNSATHEEPLSSKQNYFVDNDLSAGFTVLLVEDDLMIATATSMALSHLGCKVSWAKNGADALKKASSNDYDLIFMDIGLPDASGIDITKEIRQLTDTHRSQVFIVALTTYSEHDISQRCIDAGMQDILSKPAELPDLKATLDYFIWKKRKR